MNPSQPTSPRRRLQELLAIPDSQRTDEQWDELNELEIKLAPGNRESSSEGGMPSRDGPPPGRAPNQPRSNGQAKRNNQRKFHKRPPKGNSGGGGGAGGGGSGGGAGGGGGGNVA